VSRDYLARRPRPRRLPEPQGHQRRDRQGGAPSAREGEMTVLSLSPLAIARTLGGEACGNSVHVPGAGHSRRDRSLHITVDPAAASSFVVCDHSGEPSRVKDLAAKDFVRKALGLAFDRRAPRRPPTTSAAPHRRSEASRRNDRERTARALELWVQSCPPDGTTVQAYLARPGSPSRTEPGRRSACIVSASSGARRCRSWSPSSGTSSPTRHKRFTGRH
jgi:hypothetical protein